MAHIFYIPIRMKKMGQKTYTQCHTYDNNFPSEAKNELVLH